MRCPNCSFEIQGTPTLCPNCSDTLPRPEAWERTALTIDYSIHYWILFGNLGTILLGMVLFALSLLGSLRSILGTLLLLLVALSLMLSRLGKVWDGEPFWKKALIAAGPWLSIGAFMLLIAALFYDDNHPQTSPWSFTPSGSSGKQQRQKERRDSSQEEQAQ